MQYDIHVHVFDMRASRPGSHICPPPRRSLLLRHLATRLQTLAGNTAPSPGNIRARMNDWLHESTTDRFVLLALDKAHTPDGQPDLDQTRLSVDNDFVADWAAAHPKTLFGASIHPLRRDAIDELDRLAARGACLVKWLPSAQNILPDDPRCTPFYDKLARLRIPLLTHTGIEHTLHAFKQSMNHPHRLVLPLDRGVTVIAAHCGARMYLHERCTFRAWAQTALKHPNLYGDISGFCLPIHGSPRRRILANPELATRILYGSDFPAYAMPLWYAPTLGLARARRLQQLRNPFEKARQTTLALGIPPSAFTRAHTLLRLPDAPSPAAARKEATHEHP